MKFSLILTGVTVATLILIFGFYRLVLYKGAPADNLPEPGGPTLNSSQQPQSLPVNSEVPVATPAPSATSGTKSTASPFKSATIGTLTVLQNNTIGQTSSPAAGNSTISGSVSVSGTIPSGTSVVIVARENGTTNQYKTVVSGISASGSASWSWTTAQVGKAYDLIAVLKGSSGGVDTDYAMSQTYITTAPAYNQIFSLNAGSVLSAPTGTISTTCTTHNSNNTWSATINYPAVSGAQMYMLKAGTTSGASDIVNSTTNGQTAPATLNDSVNYFAQYAVSSVPNPTAVQYSDFSTPMTVRCP